MSERVTKADLENARKAHEVALRKYGMIAPSDRLGLAHGSKTYGQAFRVYIVHEGCSGHSETPVVRSSGFLGMTAREAYERLIEATAGIYDVMYHVDRFERQEVTES